MAEILYEKAIEDQKAFDAIVKMAREINPGLPDDLDGKVLTISLSKAGCFAFASAKLRRA